MSASQSPLPTPITSLPVVGITVAPFVLGSVLLPVDSKVLARARNTAQAARLNLAAELLSVHPDEQSGPWMEWCQRRQQLVRAQLLRESGLPEATTPYFV